MPIPYLREYEVAKVYQAKAGYDRSFDFRFRLGGVEGAAFQDIIANVAWTENKKLIAGTTRVDTSITSAAVAVFRAGTGWITLEELPEANGTSIKFDKQVIRFAKKFSIVVPLSPVLAVVPILKEANPTTTYPAEIHGVLDVVTLYHQAEFVW